MVHHFNDCKRPDTNASEKFFTANFVIVGGGAAGLSAAYFLLNKNLKTDLLEKNICDGNTSVNSAGFLTPDSELELSQPIRRYGNKCAANLWHIATSGVEMMVQRIKIPCDLQLQDFIFPGNGNSGCKDIEEEMQARQALGFSQTQ